MGELIEIYGTRPSGYSKGLSFCEITDAAPLIDGLAGPMQFNWTDRKQISTAMWPRYLSAYVRRTDSSAENFKWANRHLTNLFGPGTDSSSINSPSRHWHFGRAQVQTRIFPEELQDPKRRASNRRLQKVAGALTECSIAINPNWSPLPTATEAAALATYTPFEELKDFDKAQPRKTYVSSERRPRSPRLALEYWELSPITRTYRIDQRAMPYGYGFDAANTFLFRVALPETIHALAVDRIQDVHIEDVLPAKGPGRSSLSVHYFQPDKSRPARLTLAHGEQPGDVDRLAHRLSKKLDLPITTSEDQDY